MPLLGLGKMCCRNWHGRKDFAALGLEIDVYFAPKRSIREQQIASRRVWEAQPSVSKSIAAQDVLPDELKAAIILFFSLLDERERRVYAGLESLKLGYGGDRQMAEILGLDVSTVARGRRDLYLSMM